MAARMISQDHNFVPRKSPWFYTDSRKHSHQSIQCFHVSKKHCYGCQCLAFVTCAQMLMPAIAHRGCVDTERKSALKVDPGRKSLCCTRGLNPRQYCAWLFSRMLYQLTYSCSLSVSSPPPKCIMKGPLAYHSLSSLLTFSSWWFSSRLISSFFSTSRRASCSLKHTASRNSDG